MQSLTYQPRMKLICPLKTKDGMRRANLPTRILEIILNLKLDKAMSLNLSMESTYFYLGNVMIMLELNLGRIHTLLKNCIANIFSEDMPMILKKKTHPKPSRHGALSLLMLNNAIVIS